MKNKSINQAKLTLAIDTSCDETCAAVVSGRQILSSIIASQANLHRQYGGVFPTVAKQAHLENIEPTVQLALQRAGVSWSKVKLIAVTIGPGLAPALGVGIAKAIELGQKHQVPVKPVNHIEGHVLSVLAQTQRGSDVTNPTQPLPVLSIVVSGGHTLFVQVAEVDHNSEYEKVKIELDRQPNLKLTKINDSTPFFNSGQFQYRVLGQTIDDAAGECLDKIGRMINLGYPAGPVIEQLAKTGDADKYPFPLPMTGRPDYDMSFSGLKTHARNFTDKKWGQTPPTKQETADFCASAQFAVFQHICYKLNKLLQKKKFGQVWLGGGVAANVTLRRMLRQTIRHNPQSVRNPKLAVPYSKRLCGDNAGMVGITT